ncbi:MAG: GIY-YIG nuclease family protein [bacterium]|nr:GIY-YIG nuclease family protein [bacterium]
MYYVYILKLKNGKYYIGYSSDLKQRIREHKNGRVATTKKFPIKLIQYSAFEKKVNATNFEKYLKSSSGFAFRNKHLV